MQDTKVPAPRRARHDETTASGAPGESWRPLFLAALAETSNVTAAARAAKTPKPRVYEARRRDPAFYRAWQEALCEGYEHLEMALLQRLRSGEIKPAANARRGTRVFDNATALRLLAVHRDSVVRQQAIRGHEDTEVIIARINARIERLRRPVEALPAPDTTPNEEAGSDD